MNNNFRYTLQRKGSKLDCPACGRKKRFVPYIDTATGQPVNRTVGKCDRESNCGYHYTPKQYFADNNQQRPAWTPPARTIEPPKPTDFLSFDLVKQAASTESNFMAFILDLLKDKNRTMQLFNAYHIGATNAKEVVFWQIDKAGKVRSGKVMQYDPKTGKRSKTQSTDWIHSRIMKKAGKRPEDFNLKQCFFGEHLLTDKTKTIAVVESEKTAIIAGGLYPAFIWLAAGSLNGLNIEKCSIFEGRKVFLYPDLSAKKPNRMTAFEVWKAKATEIQNTYKCKITVSDLLEKNATDADRLNGLDIADYFIRELQKEQPPEQPALIHQQYARARESEQPAVSPETIEKNHIIISRWR